MPVLVTVILGIIEFGYAFHTRLTIKNMSLVGARAGSGLASEVYSDYSILQAVERATSGLQRDRIETIVVYRATGPNDRVPEACKTSSVPNSEHTRGCNRYTPSDFDLTEDAFGCVNAGGHEVQIDRFWCPTTRKIALLPTSPNGPPDYVGVYIKGRHDALTGLFGDSWTFTSDTVIRIEPRTLR